ncbi:hypothetical protein KCU94_g16776, partial [Aureobasidium melanogenum]
MMEARVKADLDTQFLVARLFERLRTEAPAYDWDDTLAPFHSVVIRLSIRHRACLLTTECSPTTTGMSTDIVVPHNLSIANRANILVKPTAENAAGIATQKRTETKRANEVCLMRNRAMMSSLASLVTQPASSASLVSLRG